MITHVVLLTLKDSADCDEAVARLRGLDGEIESLASLQVAPNTVSNRGNADLVLITEHKDADALEAYQVHPAHVEFVAWAGPRLDGRAVVDTDGL